MNRYSEGVPPFRPPWSLRHAHLQSFLASFRMRNRWRRRHAVTLAAACHVLDCGDGVRLMGLHSPQCQPQHARGLVVLIHGWEGSHDSVYLYSMACTLYDAGYDVFRLNLRDHGGTHHLNEDMFHSARMDEVLGAIRAIEALDRAAPLFVVGFSLGGNFALRVGLQGPARGLTPALCIGICPAINPAATMRALDSAPRAFRRYFMDKWHRTLRLKAAAWPERYNFDDVWKIPSFVDITARFAEKYTEFGALERYFQAYTLTPEMLLAGPGRLAIITAQDDPVVPYEDFRGLENQPGIAFLAPEHGGHCGFIEDWRMRSWAEARVLEWLAMVTEEAGSGHARASQQGGK